MNKRMKPLCSTTGSPKWTLPQTSAPPNEHMKNVFRKWPFSHLKQEQNGLGKKLWLDIYVEKGVWAKKSAQLVIPVRSTFQNDSHPPIGGPHLVLYFTNQIKKNIAQLCAKVTLTSIIEESWCAEFWQYFCFEIILLFPWIWTISFSVGRQPYYKCWKHSPPSMQVIIIIAIINTLINIAIYLRIAY